MQAGRPIRAFPLFIINIVKCFKKFLLELAEEMEFCL